MHLVTVALERGYSDPRWGSSFNQVEGGGRACPEGGEGHARPTLSTGGRLCTEALTTRRIAGPAAAAEALRLPVRPLGDYVPGGRVDAVRRLIGGR